jgi:hypothetical protein
MKWFAQRRLRPRERERADEQLLDDCYETLMAIYGACADRSALPVRLREALERHEPLLNALTDRVAS